MTRDIARTTSVVADTAPVLAVFGCLRLQLIFLSSWVSSLELSGGVGLMS